MSALTGSSGSAFGALRRALAADAPCPCGGARYGSCCEPKLTGTVAAVTAEQLMRSRYTAFSLGDRHYLRETWHPSTRPTDLELEETLVWESLSVDDVVSGASDDRRGTVEFRARWRDTASRASGELHERSRFVRQRGRWWYVAGE